MSLNGNYNETGVTIGATLQRQLAPVVDFEVYQIEYATKKRKRDYAKRYGAKLKPTHHKRGKKK